MVKFHKKIPLAIPSLGKGEASAEAEAMMEATAKAEVHNLENLKYV